MARHLKNEDQQYRIIVYTDGCAEETESLIGEEDLQFVPIGEPVDNVAITRFQPRRLLNDASATKFWSRSRALPSNRSNVVWKSF